MINDCYYNSTIINSNKSKLFNNLNNTLGRGTKNNFNNNKSSEKDKHLNNETICFKGFEDTLCLPPKIYKKLENKIRIDYNLSNNYPIKKEKIIELLEITPSNIEKKISNYLKDKKITVYYKSFIDNIIEDSGLYCSTIISVLNKLKHIFNQLRFAEIPVFTNMKETEYNYIDFEKFPPFSENSSIYFLPFLNISSNENSGHWTALIVFKNENIILYYDSLNKKIKHQQYLELINKFISYLNDINNNKPLFWRNNIQTQFENSYCGIYLINFLITALVLYKNNQIKNIELLSELTEKLLNESVIENKITNFLLYREN